MGFNWSSEGPPYGIPVSYTPAVSSATNMSARPALWHRIGKMMYIEGTITMGGAGDSGSQLSVALPLVNGVQSLIDTDYLSNGTTAGNGGTLVGVGEWFDSGTGYKFLFLTFLTTSTIGFRENPGLLVPTSLANADVVKWRVSVPIVGWA